MSPQHRTKASSSSQKLSPRKSPRTKQTKIPDLSAAFADSEDDDEYQPRSTSASPSKRRGKKSSESYSSEDEGQSSPRKAGKSPSRKRIRRTRDDPNSAAGSIYAHLKAVPDLFAQRNDIMLCGINPGVKSSSAGHHFAHRSNHFYPSLHLAGITEHRMKPEQDVEFPHLRRFSLGLTNLAGRPTAEGSELLPSELVDGVPVLLEKVRKWKPRTVCFVGKGISEAFMKGLKQAGAIQGGSSKKGRSSQAVSPRKAASSSRIKLEDNNIGADSASIKADEDEEAAPVYLQATVPAEVLSAYAADAMETETRRPRKGASPEKPKKQLYTKGNAKDDSGYGLLPICVPHSKSRSDVLMIDDATLFFVTPSSSARVTTHFLDDKARILKNLRRLVQHLQAGSAGKQSNGDSHTDVKIKEEVPPADGVYVEVPPYRETKTIALEVVDTSRFPLPAADTVKV
ncbi:Uracil-DNA glycosylase-like protein [Kalmanozyma brasiliensis GHG001]|uniref:Uracil-DNA glycosylase-like protein n=1 Tax=Kalmanozyma brasiliensis (strain GHG001) TaxID=1365824 RepID=UPI001CE8A576|nr:Uracil-DNA glycosylase-like protein [Kalmanozyma brasiliensis GHG001]KAF6766858.1 Uracil-DNA glycosylase-like protein [Kalmanozyma brasiliensis GHG001]